MKTGKSQGKFLFLCFCPLVLSALAGCSTATYTPKPMPSALSSVGLPGRYHRVQKKETLWRISRMYGVDLDVIAKFNNISDATDIDIGQMIFIPEAKEPRKPQTAVVTDEDFIYPVQGKISCSFGQTFKNMTNKGINILPYSDTDVIAARSGKVIFYMENFLSYGSTVIIEHPEGFSTVYANISEVRIKPGDVVQKGSVIARLSPTKDNTSSYLHFEIRKGHVAQNPVFYLSRING